MEKLKYIKLKEYSSIIVFPCVVSHDTFKHLSPVTAGFCYINEKKVTCFGESISLGLKSNEEEDSKEATKQICGIEALIDLS